MIFVVAYSSSLYLCFSSLQQLYIFVGRYFRIKYSHTDVLQQKHLFILLLLLLRFHAHLCLYAAVHICGFMSHVFFFFRFRLPPAASHCAIKVLYTFRNPHFPALACMIVCIYLINVKTACHHSVVLLIPYFFL